MAPCWRRWPHGCLGAFLLAELSVHAIATAWIRKEAEIAAHGLFQLSDASEHVQGYQSWSDLGVGSKSRPSLSQPDDRTVWKLLHAGSEDGKEFSEIMQDVQKSEPTTTTTPSPESFQDSIPAPLLSMRSPTAPSRIRSHAFHPTKGGNLNHSGYSPYVGVQDLAFPTWTFVHPQVQPKGLRTATRRVFHGSPLIDADLNVYIQSTSGWIFSLTKDGDLRWSFDLNSEDPQNPGNMALLDGTAFVCTEDGMAWAIDLVEGSERWRQKIATHCSTDAFSVVARKGSILIPCNPANGDDPDNMEGSHGLCAVSETDGAPRWTFNLNRYGSKGYNLAPSVVDGIVYFTDLAGAVYAISEEDGQEVWHHPGSEEATFSTATSVVGPDSRLYNAFNVGEKGGSGTQGVLRCHDLKFGDVVWSKSFPEGINAAPAVGPMGAKNRTAVIVGVGNNPECLPEPVIGPTKRAKLFALDAETGQTLWTFTAPEYSLSCAGNTPAEVCCPSMWSQPTLAADGRVYVNWSGGKFFTLLDANLDGTIDANDPREFSFYHHGKGSNSQTALAPGLMVAAVCNKVLAYQT
ncbi:bamB [Symbiodinium natans]|uniref:BamB protein n=1 Tax=Symbiodinium natans TaxID=878477 RepID=A0A812MKD5_9DINO|nr:bamB [Symbiodinium natans]